MKQQDSEEALLKASETEEIGLDPERSCARRVARSDCEMSQAKRCLRAERRIDEKLSRYVMEDRFRHMRCLENASVMAGQAAPVATGVRRRCAAVLVATSRALLGLPVEQKGLGSRRACAHRHHQ